VTWLLLVAVLLGGVAQRVTGMGLALVSVPLIVVAVGPGPGSVIGNLLGVVASVIVYIRVHRSVEWRLLWAMVPSGFIGVVAGTAVAEVVSVAWAQVLVGGLVLAAIPASFFVARTRRAERGVGITSAFAAVAGSMSALAGIGGPAMAALRNLTRWEPVSFAATLQPFFIAVATVAVLSRVGADPSVWPDLGLLWAAMGLALLSGIALGDVVAQRLPPRVNTAAITIVASSGAAWTLVRGFLAL
jgi:uncharacterized membrane protein YfcA